LPGTGNEIDTLALHQLVIANSKSKAIGFTYTHKPVGLVGQALINARAIYAANKSGFRINLSADSLADADRLADLKIAPVVVVVNSDAPKKMRTPAGRHVILCPYEPGVLQCDGCRLCAKERNAIIGFAAHGTSKKKVNIKLRVLNNVQ